jgi:hypothetical protein
MRFLTGLTLGLWLGAVNSALILQLLAVLSQKIALWIQSLSQSSPIS